MPNAPFQFSGAVVLPVRALGVAVVVLVSAVVVEVEGRSGAPLDAVVGRRVRTDRASQDASGELPEAPPGVRRATVVLDRRLRSIHHLARYARVGDRNGYPFLAGPFREARLLAVAPPVLRRLGNLAGAHPQPVVPPDAVLLLRFQARRYLRRHQLLDLLESVGLIHIV